MLGERTTKALVLELDNMGVSMKPENFDIIKFDKGLRQVFGNAADLFMEQIYHDFKTRVSRYGNIEETRMPKEMRAADKISRLLAPSATNTP